MTLQAIAIVVTCALFVYGVSELATRNWRVRRWFDRGVEALNTGGREDARKAFERVLKLQPLWSPARRILARIYADEGRYDEAEKHFRLACEFEPRNADSLLELAWFLAIFKGPHGEQQAGDVLRKAISLAPRLLETHREAPELTALRRVAALQTFFSPQPPKHTEA
jgi:cytochrome c-type biogenesis protein CcmH/NrfG